MRIVARGRITDGTSAPTEQVAQVVRQDLELIRSEIAVIPQKVVVGRTTGPLNSVMRNQEEVVLCWVDDVGVHHCSRRHIAGFAHLQVLN